MSAVNYKNYLLAILVLIGVISYFDRFVFALAMESIKQDLSLSDSQLGLMTGIGFSAFYALAGIPIARWADRGNRITISALAVALVGGMVSLCGMVTNFTQLLLAKAGIAVGEAGSVPAAQSLIAEHFERGERPRATAIYTMNYPISMIVGYLAGGYLIDALGWRGAFIVVGIPGVLFALLVKLTLKEPRLDRTAIERPQSPPFLIVLKILWQQKTFKHILLSFCVSYFFLASSSQWLAAFFMRTHGTEATELGGWLALSWGVFGIVGNYLGGVLATRYAAHRESLQMRGLAIVVLVFGVLNVSIYLASTQEIALLFVALSALVTSLSNGALFSAMQSLVADKMRSVSVALVFLFANLVGFGLGPLALGYVSDLLHPVVGQESLRYSLVIFSPGVIWVAFHYWMASKTIEKDIELVESSDATMVSGSNHRSGSQVDSMDQPAEVAH